MQHSWLPGQTWKQGTKTAQLWRSRLAEYAYPTIGDRSVSDITSADVLGTLLPIWADKRATAATKVLSTPPLKATTTAS